jgi:ankyrin repeat protein
MTYSRVDLISWLIDKGADVDCPDKTGYTPLFYTTSAQVVSLLLKKGANPAVRALTRCTDILKIPVLWTVLGYTFWLESDGESHIIAACVFYSLSVRPLSLVDQLMKGRHVNTPIYIYV